MDMKRFAAGGAALLLCIGLLTGCGTAHRSQLESSEEEMERFAPEYSPVIPSDNGQMVMPELERPEQLAGGRDVTELYKNSFVGLWDTDDRSEIFEFKTNENLVRWRADGSASESFTYWFQEDDNQPRLYLFRNGDTEAAVYSFTCGPDAISLFSPDSGDVRFRLTRRTDPVPEQVAARPDDEMEDQTAQTEAPMPVPAEPSAAATAAPTVQPTEPAGTAAPAPSTTSAPTQAPSPTPTAPPSPVPVLPEAVQKAMPAIECAMDVVLSGYGFDPEDENSYWAIMVRYLSRNSRGDEADGCFTVSREQLEDASREVFADFSEIPQCPADAPYVTELPPENGAVSYRFLWGAPADCELTVLSCEADALRLSVGGGAVYRIVVSDSGAILSVLAE